MNGSDRRVPVVNFKYHNSLVKSVTRFKTKCLNKFVDKFRFQSRRSN